MRHLEKRTHLLAQLGANLRAQRETVFRENEQRFAERLRLFGVDRADEHLVRSMENGSATVDISSWIGAFQAMQVADAVVRSTRNDAALFLAAAEMAPGIEAEMAHNLNSGKEAP